MSTPQVAPLLDARESITGTFVDIAGERYYRIENYDAMPPFLMSIVSDSDHWLFISSNGGLTCGRRSPDHALFPYYTDDRVHDGCSHTGPKTVLRVDLRGQQVLWEPFAESPEPNANISRSLYKSACGNRIRFEETNHDLDLKFWYEWMSSERFGFVRRSCLENISSQKITVSLLDGIQNILPSGVTRRFQLEYSTLVDGYKRTELDEETGLALFRLTSVPVDRPEPSESLRVNAAWSVGLPSPTTLLSSTQIGRFRKGATVHSESEIHGQRGAYLLACELTLAPAAEQQWIVVADVDKDSAQVHDLLHLLRNGSDLPSQIEEDVQRGTQNLLRIVATADGIQITADEPSCWHHFASTLFNAMRGGIPENGYKVHRNDFQRYLASSNRLVATRHAAFVDALPESIALSELHARAAAQNDVDLERLANEYLPLMFSRRHGDPSRPWNNFEIKLKDTHGNRVLGYEGNWRDIFQNWEALSLSFPGLTRSMLFKFLDSSTADGYNPYRIMNDGYEWELLDVHDSWSYIGYWGDHQVIYLLKLLERAAEHDLQGLAALLTKPIFTFANVPYRIRPYEDILRDPRDTIIFDHEAHRRTMARAGQIGADGKSLADDRGETVHATLSEKLLIVILTKLSNYVPEAGIWLNTQRPEWNDANNALAGVGASMVTLYQLRRFLVFCKKLISHSPGEAVEVASELATFFANIEQVLRTHLPVNGRSVSDTERKTILDLLGNAGAAYRATLYGNGFSGARVQIPVAEVLAFCDTALLHVEHSISANVRSDGLYHSYNILSFTDHAVGIRRLSEMLEGQVAVLGSGALCACKAAELLDALANSPLYRADQNSYLLYPARPLPRFVEKNNISAEETSASPVLRSMAASGDSRIIVRDYAGECHFNADLRNAEVLKRSVAELRLSAEEEKQIVALYEKVFEHHTFTGRSGTMYKYEGLGCIYWHMVSKLLLSVQEVIRDAVDSGADANVIARLKSSYGAIRRGLGTHKSPAVFGAVPFDPYSHTPEFAGAQQPGMTGQAKEDFLSRMGEVGVEVRDGVLSFTPELLESTEFLHSPRVFTSWNRGNPREIEVPADTFAYSICQVPVIAHKQGPAHIQVIFRSGDRHHISGLRLPEDISAMVFARSGEVEQLNVYFAMSSPR
jgi:hypothetical protein